MIGKVMILIVGAFGLLMIGALLILTPIMAIRERDPVMGGLSAFMWLGAVGVVLAALGI